MAMIFLVGIDWELEHVHFNKGRRGGGKKGKGGREEVQRGEHGIGRGE